MFVLKKCKNVFAVAVMPAIWELITAWFFSPAIWSVIFQPCFFSLCYFLVRHFQGLQVQHPCQRVVGCHQPSTSTPCDCCTRQRSVVASRLSWPSTATMTPCAGDRACCGILHWLQVCSTDLWTCVVRRTYSNIGVDASRLLIKGCGTAFYRWS